MEVLQSPREVARSSRKAFQCPSSPSPPRLPPSLCSKAERLLGSDEACELDLKKKNEKWDKLCSVPFQSNLSGSSPGCTSEPSLRILKYLDRWKTANLIKKGIRQWLINLCTMFSPCPPLLSTEKKTVSSVDWKQFFRDRCYIHLRWSCLIFNIYDEHNSHLVEGSAMTVTCFTGMRRSTSSAGEKEKLLLIILNEAKRDSAEGGKSKSIIRYDQ